MSAIPTQEFSYEVIEDGYTIEITEAPLLLTVTEDVRLYIADVDK